MGKIKGAPELTDSTQALIKPTKYAKSNTTIHDELANLRTASTLEACTDIFKKISLSPEKTEIPSLEASHLYLQKLADFMSNEDENAAQVADAYFSNLMREAKNFADCQQAWNEAGAFFPESRCELTNTEKLFLDRQYELLRNLGTERDEAIKVLLQSETLEELNSRLRTRYYKATFKLTDSKDPQENTKTHYINVNKLRYENSPFYDFFYFAAKNNYQEPIEIPSVELEAFKLIDTDSWKAKDYPTPKEFLRELAAYGFACFDKGINSCLEHLQSMLADDDEGNINEWNQLVKQEEFNRVLEDFKEKTTQENHPFKALSNEARQSLINLYKQFAWVKRKHVEFLNTLYLPSSEELLQYFFQYQRTFPGLEEAYFHSDLIAAEPILAPLAFLLKLWNPKQLKLEISPNQRRGYFPLLVANAQNLENVKLSCKYDSGYKQRACVGMVNDLNLFLRALKHTKAKVELNLNIPLNSNPSVLAPLENVHSNDLISSLHITCLDPISTLASTCLKGLGCHKRLEDLRITSFFAPRITPSWDSDIPDFSNLKKLELTGCKQPTGKIFPSVDEAKIDIYPLDIASIQNYTEIFPKLKKMQIHTYSLDISLEQLIAHNTLESLNVDYSLSEVRQPPVVPHQPALELDAALPPGTASLGNLHQGVFPTIDFDSTVVGEKLEEINFTTTYTSNDATIPFDKICAFSRKHPLLKLNISAISAKSLSEVKKTLEKLEMDVKEMPSKNTPFKYIVEVLDGKATFVPKGF